MHFLIDAAVCFDCSQQVGESTNRINSSLRSRLSEHAAETVSCTTGDAAL